MGVLSSCLTHVALVQAADLGVSLEAVEAEVTGEHHPLAGKPGFEDVPIYPHNIQYKLHITSNESPERIAELHEAIEKVCPIFNLLKNPQVVTGEVIHTTTEAKQEA